MPRYAKKCTIDELKDFILNKYKKDVWDEYEADETDDLFEHWLWEQAAYSVPIKDYKIEFDMENFNGPTENDFGVSGFYQCKDFAVALCCAGGDWEDPMCFVMYIDDKDKIRAYIPTAGNVFDFYAKCAFGSTHEFVKGMPDNFSFVKHPEYGDDSNSTWPGKEPELNEEYDRWRDYVVEEKGFNVSLMLEDVESRICVKGNESHLKPKPNNPYDYNQFLNDYPQEFTDFVNDKTAEYQQKYPNGYPFKSSNQNNNTTKSKPVIQNVIMGNTINGKPVTGPTYLGNGMTFIPGSCGGTITLGSGPSTGSSNKKRYSGPKVNGGIVVM